MTSQRGELVNPDRRLPELSLASVAGSGTYPVRRQGRLSTVLVLIHDPECSECGAYLSSLASAIDRLQEWDGRVLAITAAERPEPVAEADHTVPILLDSERRVIESLGVGPPAVAIADQWGQVHVLEEAASGHGFMSVEDIVGWLRYLAVQCPECQGEAL